MPSSTRGLGVTHPTWDSARSAIRLALSSFIPSQVITLTPEMCVRASMDPVFEAVIRGAGIVVADGVGVVWGETRLTGKKPEKIPGIDLATWALEEVDRIAGRVYLVGAKPEVVEAAAEYISRNYPRLSVAGYRDGYFSDTDENEVVKRIAATEPHLLLVGMGSPKQDIFISQHLLELRCAVGIGVGGSFDVWSGTVKRAPAVFQKTGTEWLYRTLTQPKARLKRTSDLIKFIRLCMTKTK
jgi:N-acetylglucosaminyldiphosphoundecaprenol N-acetyl-beta-D-mannosaminyltransferase